MKWKLLVCKVKCHKPKAVKIQVKITNITKIYIYMIELEKYESFMFYI